MPTGYKAKKPNQNSLNKRRAQTSSGYTTTNNYTIHKEIAITNYQNLNTACRTTKASAQQQGTAPKNYKPAVPEPKNTAQSQHATLSSNQAGIQSEQKRISSPIQAPKQQLQLPNLQQSYPTSLANPNLSQHYKSTGTAPNPSTNQSPSRKHPTNPTTQST